MEEYAIPSRPLHRKNSWSGLSRLRCENRSVMMSFLGSEGGGKSVEIGDQPQSWVGVERLPQFLEYRSQRSVSG